MSQKSAFLVIFIIISLSVALLYFLMSALKDVDISDIIKPDKEVSKTEDRKPRPQTKKTDKTQPAKPPEAIFDEANEVIENVPDTPEESYLKHKAIIDKFKVAENKPPETKVERMFEAVRNGDYTKVYSIRDTINEKDSGEISLLISALKDENEDVRRNAVIALEKIGPEAYNAAPLLIEALGDESEKVSVSASYTLGWMGLKNPDIVYQLIVVLASDNPKMRANAANALGVVGPGAGDAVQELVELLKDENAPVRRNASYALGNIGQAASDGVPALVKNLRDKDEYTRITAAISLALLEAPEAEKGEKILKDALNHEWPKVRSDAANALGLIGADAKSSVAPLLPMVKDENWEVRRNAVIAIARISPTLHRVFNTVVEALDDEQPYVRAAAAQAFGIIGKDSDKDVVSVLKKALENEKDDYVRNQLEREIIKLVNNQQ